MYYSSKTTECDESSIDNQSVAESQHPSITETPNPSNNNYERDIVNLPSFLHHDFSST